MASEPHGAGESSTSHPDFDLDKFQLSANLFTADIESWIPDTFGPRKSEAQQQADFSEAIRQASLFGNDDLGLGHPDQGKGRGVVGLDSLHRKLGRIEKGKGKASSSAQAQDPSQEKMDEGDGSDNEEESRSKILGKKKRPAVDLMAPKKKAKMSTSSPAPVVPSSSDPLLLKPPSTTSQASKASSPDPLLLKPSDNSTFAPDSQGDPIHDDNDGPHAPSPDDGVFPFSGPISLDSPQAKRILAEKLQARSTSTTPIPPSKQTTSFAHGKAGPSGQSGAENGFIESTENEDELVGHGMAAQSNAIAGMTKNQRKNERKKRAKMRKQEIHGS